MVVSARKIVRGLLFTRKDCTAKDRDTLDGFRSVCRKNNINCAEQQIAGS